MFNQSGALDVFEIHLTWSSLLAISVPCSDARATARFNSSGREASTATHGLASRNERARAPLNVHLVGGTRE